MYTLRARPGGGFSSIPTEGECDDERWRQAARRQQSNAAAEAEDDAGADQAGSAEVRSLRAVAPRPVTWRASRLFTHLPQATCGTSLWHPASAGPNRRLEYSLRRWSDGNYAAKRVGCRRAPWYTVSGPMGIERMPLQVELIPDLEQGGFTAVVPDVPAYGEGETEEEAIADLKEALRAFIETVGLDETLSRVRPNVVVREVDLDLAELARG